MATPFEDTPKWFNAEFYLASKLSQLQTSDPSGNWTRETMLKAFDEANYSNPYDHYLASGDSEGLSPNPLFNNAEYLAAKTAQLGSTWTPEMVAKAIKDSGMTLMQHYEMHGSAEGISPSSAFNQDKYYEAKLDQLQMTEPTAGWTLEKMKAAFAEAGMTPLDHYLLCAKDEGLDKYDYSENGAPIPHPGNTKIVLTTGADTVSPEAKDAAFQTTDRDDVINAKTGTSTTATLNPGDVIDGGKGQDTLVVDMQNGAFGGFTKGGSMTNVETVELRNAETRKFDAKSITGVNTYVVDGGDKGNVTISNVESTATGFAIKQAAGTFTAQFLDSAISGKEDTAHVTLNGVGSEDADVSLTVKGMGSTSKVENLNLYAQGKDNFVTLNAGLEGVMVMGAGNVDVAVNAGLKSFNAANATGEVVADLTLAAGSLKTVTGGSNDDTITVGSLLAPAVIDGGDGNDTLTFSTFTGGDVIKNTITNVETFEFATNATTRTLTVNMANITDLQTVKIEGVEATASTDDFIFTGAGASGLDLEMSKMNTLKSFSFDGSGVLNVSLEGEATTAGATLSLLTANNASALTITNNSDTPTDVLTVTDIVAKSATSLTVDTGYYGVNVSGAATADVLSSLEAVTFKGHGDAKFVVSGDGADLTTVNASEFGGKLTLDLSDLTTSKGVTVSMGSAGATSLEGTVKSDTFELGAGSEMVMLSSASAADHIIGFGDGGNDQILADGLAKFAAYKALPATPAATEFAKNSVFTFAEALTTTLTDTAAVKALVVKAILSPGTGGTSAGDKIYVLAADADEGVGVYTVVLGVVASTSNVTANDITSVTLMGIADGAEISDFGAANFVL